VGLPSWQRPWLKIIEQDKLTGQMLPFTLVTNEREIGQRSKLKAALKRLEEIVLVAW
jgi:hypothetical protein